MFSLNFYCVFLVCVGAKRRDESVRLDSPNKKWNADDDDDDDFDLTMMMKMGADPSSFYFYLAVGRRRGVRRLSVVGALLLLLFCVGFMAVR